MGDQDEPHLLHRALQGDEDAIGELLLRHGPQVRRQLCIGTKWRSLVDEDDLMQVTYLEAFLRIRQFRSDGDDGFARWLSRIAQNNLRDAVRDLGRKKRGPAAVHEPNDGTSGQFRLDDLGRTTTTPSGAVGRREVQQAVTDAMELLPKPYADVLRLCDLEGHSTEDAGKVLARSSGAVRMLLARARDRLRETLGSGSAFFSDGA